MQYINTFFLILFLFSAFVQYNDPDPLSWIVIYGLAAFVCIFYLFKKIYWLIPAVTGGIAFLWMIILFPEISNTQETIIWPDVFGRADMKTEAVEITREIFGLFLVFIWMAVLTLQGLRKE
jgi:hypothetical protein